MNSIDDSALSSLEAVADGVIGLLRERYPTLYITKHQLQNPLGYGIRFNEFLLNWYSLWVKIAKHALLVDINSPVAIMERLAELDYGDPRLVEKMFTILDRFVVDGELLARLPATEFQP